MRGERPNSPMAMTSVSLSSPRWSISSSSAERPRSSFGQCRFLSGAEVRGVRVPGIRLPGCRWRPRASSSARSACRPRSAGATAAGLGQTWCGRSARAPCPVPSSDRTRRALCPRAPGRRPCRNIRRWRSSFSAFSRSGMEPLMPFSSSKRSFRRSGGTSLRSERSSSLDGLGGILIEAVRIVGLAEETGRAAFADDARFLQRPRQFTNGSTASWAA